MVARAPVSAWFRSPFSWPGLAVLAIWLSACAAQAAQEPAAVQIVMRDHVFDPELIHLTTGQQVRIEFVNEGKIPHAVMVGRELERLTWGPGERPQQDFFDGVEVRRKITYGSLDTVRGTDLTLYPGGSAELVFTVPAGRTGTWEIGCLLPGHYESGMRGTLTVE